MGCPFLNQIDSSFLQLLQFVKISFQGEWPELYIGIWMKFCLYRVFMFEIWCISLKMEVYLYSSISIGNTICDRFFLCCGKWTSIDFVACFYPLIGKGTQALLFSSSFPQGFLAETLVINKERKRKTKLPSLLLNFTFCYCLQSFSFWMVQDQCALAVVLDPRISGLWLTQSGGKKTCVQHCEFTVCPRGHSAVASYH